MSNHECKACISCGFLAVIGKKAVTGANQPIWEASEEARAKGTLFQAIPGDTFHQLWDAKPVCFRGLAQIADEIEGAAKAESASGPAYALVAIRVLGEDRECSGWRKHQPGLSPQEHFQQHMFEALEAQRRQWEATQERARQEWEESREADRRKYENRQRRVDWVLAFAALVFAAVALLAATPDSIIGHWLVKSGLLAPHATGESARP